MSTRRGSSYPAAFERRLKPIKEEPSTKKVDGRSPVPPQSAWSAGQPKVGVKTSHAEYKPSHAEYKPSHAEYKPSHAEFKPSHAEYKPSRPQSKSASASVSAELASYVDLPWPETDDFGTPQALSPEFPKKALTPSEVERLGDIISNLIDTEIKMCREAPIPVTNVHIQLYPSPPSERALNSYVTAKVKERFAVDIIWQYGRDTITIMF